MDQLYIYTKLANTTLSGETSVNPKTQTTEEGLGKPPGKGQEEGIPREKWLLWLT